MPRGGLEPMWTASVGITLPVWQKHKQSGRWPSRNTASTASGWEVERVRCLLAQRVQERQRDLDAALQVIRLYRAGLLVQSESTFRATLAQYVVGKVPFLSVLEALNGWIADQSGLLQAQAQAQAMRIAQDELNLGRHPGHRRVGPARGRGHGRRRPGLRRRRGQVRRRPGFGRRLRLLLLILRFHVGEAQTMVKQPDPRNPPCPAPPAL